MGDIHRRVIVSRVTQDGKQGDSSLASALIDQGSTKTVISTALARKLGGKSLPKKLGTIIEGRSIPQKLIAVKLDAPGCRHDVLAVAVDDKLMLRAGRGPDGKPTHQMILGHDYLENQHAAIRYTGATQSDEIACHVEPLRRKI